MFRSRQCIPTFVLATIWVEATLNDVETSLLKIVSDAVRETTSVFAGLSEMVSGLDRAAQEMPDVIKVWLDWSTGFRADVWPRYILMQEQLHAAARKVLMAGKRQGSLSENLNVKAAARLFVGGGHTVVLARFAGASTSEIEVLIQYLIASVMNIGQVVFQTPRAPDAKNLACLALRRQWPFSMGAYSFEC